MQVDKNDLYRILKDTNEVCSNLKIKWCLNFGTLLGAVRESDVIDNGKEDIDIFLICCELPEYNKFMQSLIDKGYTVSCWNMNPSNAYIGTSGIEIGRVGYSIKHNDGYYYWQSAKIHQMFLDELKTLKINGIDYPVPNYAETFVRILYGPTWRIPDPKAHTCPAWVVKSFDNFNKGKYD